MSKFERTVITCPVCSYRLAKNKGLRTYKCGNNHSFDISKGNYVNLLLPNKKKSNNPGDPKEMVAARTDFLERGFYKKLANIINTNITRQLQTLGIDEYKVLDLGCGEGYYLKNIMSIFKKKSMKTEFYGMDVSKHATQAAGKTIKEATIIVANNFSIPFEDKSLDLIYSVFSPVDMPECVRVLKKNGYFVRILPNKDHLVELKKAIYPTLTDKRVNEFKTKEAGLTLVDKVDIKYEMDLNKENLLSLLKMTPHYWRITPEDREKFDQHESMIVTVDMALGVYKKA